MKMEAPVRQKREVLTEAERRGRAALDRVQRGQVSRARQELVGSVLAPKTLATLTELRSHRPQAQLREILKKCCMCREASKDGEAPCAHSSLRCPHGRVLTVWIMQSEASQKGTPTTLSFRLMGRSIRSRVLKFHSDEVDGGSGAPADVASSAYSVFPIEPVLVARRIRTPPRNPPVRRRGARGPVDALLFAFLDDIHICVRQDGHDFCTTSSE